MLDSQRLGGLMDTKIVHIIGYESGEAVYANGQLLVADIALDTMEVCKHLEGRKIVDYKQVRTSIDLLEPTDYEFPMHLSTLLEMGLYLGPVEEQNLFALQSTKY